MKKIIFTFSIFSIIYLVSNQVYAQYGYCQNPYPKTEVHVSYSNGYHNYHDNSYGYYYGEGHRHHYHNEKVVVENCGYCYPQQHRKVVHHKPKVRYIYYVDYNMYYDRHRKAYVYLHGPNWVVSSYLPAYIRPRQLANARREYYNWNTNEPHRVYRSQAQQGRARYRRN